MVSPYKLNKVKYKLIALEDVELTYGGEKDQVSLKYVLLKYKSRQIPNTCV